MLKLSAIFLRFLEKTTLDWLKKHNLMIVWRLEGGGIGDVIVSTAVLRLIHKKLGCRFIVATKFPALFENNPLVIHNVALNRQNFITKPLIKLFFRHIKQDRIAHLVYKPNVKLSKEEHLEVCRRPVHMVALITAHLPLELDYSKIACELYFSEAERLRFKKKFEHLGNYSIIKPTGRTDFTQKKEWGIANFQGVVERSPSIHWVQMGYVTEPLLDGVVDLRGQTGLRDMLYLISRAKSILTVEGLYNHVASAFNVPCVVVFSGLIRPENVLYQNTFLVRHDDSFSCMPCLPEPGDCVMDTMPCIREISIERVLKTLENLPLAVGQTLRSQD